MFSASNNQHANRNDEVDLDETDLALIDLLAISKLKTKSNLLVKRGVDQLEILEDKEKQLTEAERKSKILKTCRKRHELSFLRQSVVAKEKLHKLKAANDNAKALLEAIKSTTKHI